MLIKIAVAGQGRQNNKGPVIWNFLLSEKSILNF